MIMGNGSSSPMCTVCNYTDAGDDKYCDGDHAFGRTVGTGYTQDACASVCSGDASCAFFELGCAAVGGGTGECILMPNCTLGQAPSKCGTLVRRKDTSTCVERPVVDCPLAPFGQRGTTYGPVNIALSSIFGN